VEVVAARTILLYEDDDALRELLIELLRDEFEAQIVPCPSIGELVQRAAAQAPDMIIADFWGASHLRLADDEREQVTALAKLAPTVLVSARQWTHGPGADDLGLAAVISKPLDLEAFVAVLRQTLGAETEAAESTFELPRREAFSVVLLPWVGPA
jgi:DNA-binding NtrC family response regulator